MTPNGTQFSVLMLARFRTELEHLADAAQSRGLAGALASLLREVVHQLQLHPRDWGDPYTNYRGLAAVGYSRTLLTAGLQIHYLVHDSHPLVWLSAVYVLPESPFIVG